MPGSALRRPVPHLLGNSLKTGRDLIKMATFGIVCQNSLNGTFPTVSLVKRAPACDQCGGNGYVDASSFGEYGWHACYRCGTTGEGSIWDNATLYDGPNLRSLNDLQAAFAPVVPFRSYEDSYYWEDMLADAYESALAERSERFTRATR